VLSIASDHEPMAAQITERYRRLPEGDEDGEARTMAQSGLRHRRGHRGVRAGSDADAAHGETAVGHRHLGTTTVAGESGSACNSVPTCYVALGGTLPTLASDTNKTMKRATAKLQRSYRRLGKGLNRAASSPSKKQPKRYRTTRKLVQKLVTAAERDSGKGTLGVSLPAVQGAATALLAEIPF
jgi:hypothetical protein